MSLIAQIKQDQLQARKVKDALRTDLLTTLIGEAEMVGKNDGNRETTDAEVVAVVRKFLNNIKDTLAALGNIEGGIALKFMEEMQILDAYMPQQMNALQLEKAVGTIKNEINAGPKDMGKIMAILKQRFAGQYDGKMASDIIKRVLV